MKPEDLKPPFSWEQRHVVLRDRVLYVPPRYTDYGSFSFPRWDSPELFSAERPVHVEYCSGNGAWVAAKAQQHPEINWVAIEMKFDRVRKIWSKMKNLDLDNLMIICGEGLQATQHYIPESSVKAVFINFPDPWPKKRHAKHRIVQLSFLKQMHRILQPEGNITAVTDDETYSGEIIEQFAGHCGFESELPHPHFTTDFPDYGTSYFDELWRSKGKAIRYHSYRKTDGTANGR